jgi:DNA-binding NarL/FixJ family response regulator
MSAADREYDFDDTGQPVTPEGSQPIKVLIVDDHPGVRAGIRSLLLTANDMVVVDEGGNGQDALMLARSQAPDIVLLDIELPGMRGDAVMRLLHESLPHIKVLAVSSYNDLEYVKSMLENGASGYITKDEAPDVLVEAIRSIMHKGASWFRPRATQLMEDNQAENQTLTERELEILQHVTLERTAGEIAHLIGMEERRVGNHLDLLMKKFGVESLQALRPIARRILAARGLA